VKHRETREVIIGRTVPLKPTQSAQLGAVLKPAGADHRWPDEISSQRWGGRDAKKPLTKVQPTVIAEVTADAATQAGQVRHGMRFVRIRADLRPEDLSTLPNNGEIR
jgi:ATP-dependent DNA ligase